MSRLDELIREYCPDGVEYKTLGEIGYSFFRGSGIKRDELTESGTPCVRYGEIYTTYGIYFDKCVSYTDESKISSPKYMEYGDILFAITGESVDDIAKSTAYIGNDRCLVGGDIVVMKHNQNPKYISYALSTLDAQKQKSLGKVKSKVVHSNVPSIQQIKIPLPPIEVQREIVKILDNFTLLTAELTAELTARRKQYEYYRDKLLSFDVHGGETGEVEWRTLGEVFTVSDYVANGSFADIRNNVTYLNEPDFAVLIRTADYSCDFQEDKFVYINEHAYNFLKKSQLFGGEIIINNIGAGVGTTFKCPVLSKKMSLAPNAVMVITPNNDFYYHWFKSKHGQSAIKKITSCSSMPKFNKTGLRSIQVPVPTLEVQTKIVNVLDNFEKICSDLSIGLPAEIEARQKQYEYYRDKLLSFKEL